MSTACGRPQGEQSLQRVRLMQTGEGGGQKPDFFVDVINGWPLTLSLHFMLSSGKFSTN